MWELLQISAACIALLAAACVAFVRPDGALLKSVLFGGAATVGAGVIWRASQGDVHSPWLAAMLVCAAAGALFATAALLRHALNALGARALFS